MTGGGISAVTNDENVVVDDGLAARVVVEYAFAIALEGRRGRSDRGCDGLLCYQVLGRVDIGGDVALIPC